MAAVVAWLLVWFGLGNTRCSLDWAVLAVCILALADLVEFELVLPLADHRPDVLLVARILVVCYSQLDMDPWDNFLNSMFHLYSLCH